MCNEQYIVRFPNPLAWHGWGTWLHSIQPAGLAFLFQKELSRSTSPASSSETGPLSRDPPPRCQRYSGAAPPSVSKAAEKKRRWLGSTWKHREPTTVHGMMIQMQRIQNNRVIQRSTWNVLSVNVYFLLAFLTLHSSVAARRRHVVFLWRKRHDWQTSWTLCVAFTTFLEVDSTSFSTSSSATKFKICPFSKKYGFLFSGLVFKVF